MKTNGLIPSVFILAFGCICSPSCKKSGIQPDILKPVTLPAGGSSVIQANGSFAFDFLHADLLLDNTSGNRLISPLSIYLAFSMVYNGAANATRDSMEKALRLSNINIGDLNATCSALIKQLPTSDNKVTLDIADAVWYLPSVQPQAAYLNTIDASYQAMVKPLDFANSSTALNTINTWVADHTQQKIPKILDQVSPGQLMVLVNAIYFKGVWKYQFPVRNTIDGAFYRPDGTTVTTPFMAMEHDSLLYMRNDSLQMVQLPYGGGNFSMYVIEPSDNLPVASFLPVLTNGYFQYLQTTLHPRTLAIDLPKFKYSYSIQDLSRALGWMGMGIAFTDKADLSGMYSVPAYISQAVHKTFIEVDEEGTTAAAATAVGVVGTAVPAIPLMQVNHPFVYIIQEKTSGAILFTGVVNDPTLP